MISDSGEATFSYGIGNTRVEKYKVNNKLYTLRTKPLSAENVHEMKFYQFVNNLDSDLFVKMIAYKKDNKSLIILTEYEGDLLPESQIDKQLGAESMFKINELMRKYKWGFRNFYIDSFCVVNGKVKLCNYDEVVDMSARFAVSSLYSKIVVDYQSNQPLFVILSYLCDLMGVNFEPLDVFNEYLSLLRDDKKICVRIKKILAKRYAKTVYRNNVAFSIKDIEKGNYSEEYNYILRAIFILINACRNNDRYVSRFLLRLEK